MNIEKLNCDKVKDYEKLNRAPVSENIARSSYRGLIAYDDKDVAVGALVWKLTKLEDGGIGEEIEFYDAESEDAANALMEVHEIQILEEGVTSSYFELEEVPYTTVAALGNAGYVYETEESRDIEVTVADIRKAMLRDISFSKNIVSLEFMSDGDFWNGTSLCIYHGITGLLEDLEDLGREWFDPLLSCGIRSEGWIKGMLLIRHRASGDYMPVLLFNAQDNKKELMQMICYTCKIALEMFDDDTRFFIRRRNDIIKSMTAHVFPDKKGRDVIVGRREIISRTG